MVQQPLVRERGQMIQSVQRAAALLRALSDSTPEMGVSELSRRVNLHKSTVSRLLSTLEHEGLVERVAGSDKFRLGYEFARLAGQLPHFGDLRETARPMLQELATASEETVHLAVLDGEEIVNVEQISGRRLVRDTDWVGRRTPLHCVANGKALLAFLPAAEIDRVLSHPLARFTERTITRRTALKAELSRARRRGFATALGEIEPGLYAVAAPIWNREGRVVAAVSVSGPSYRLTPRNLAHLGALTRATADKISLRLGYVARDQC